MLKMRFSPAFWPDRSIFKGVDRRIRPSATFLSGPRAVLPMSTNFRMKPHAESASEPTGGIPGSGAEPGRNSFGTPEVGARAWTLVLAIGVFSGVLSWVLAERLSVPEMGVGSKGGANFVDPSVASLWNGMLTFGLLGASLAAGLGLAGGLIRGSSRGAFVAGIVGLVLGGLVALGAARGLIPVYYNHARDATLAMTFGIHAAIAAAIGAAAGVAFGLGMGGFRNLGLGLVGGILGAVVGTIFYEVAGTIVFPLAQTDRPLGMTPPSRLTALLLIAAPVAAGLLYVVRRQQNAKT
jgi:hypothetical protein